MRTRFEGKKVYRSATFLAFQTLFCSNCGEPLGAVAHITNNELLCENCYLKVSSGASTALAHTVALSLANDEERRDASSAISDEAEHTPAQVAAPPLQQQPPKASEEVSIISKFIAPGEALLWKRSFSKGIINRHLTYTEFVTNRKAVCLDDEHGTAIRCALLRECSLAIVRERRQYSGTRAGYGHYGAYTGSSSGTSVTYGDLDFIVRGKVAMTLFNVRDPSGLKRLIEASVKSSPMN
jgi:hypothetical protein